MTVNEGLCAGGPANGSRIASEAEAVLVPILLPGEAGIGSGTYRFNDAIKMWVWQGPWYSGAKMPDRGT